MCCSRICIVVVYVDSNSRSTIIAMFMVLSIALYSYGVA